MASAEAAEAAPLSSAGEEAARMLGITAGGGTFQWRDWRPVPGASKMEAVAHAINTIVETVPDIKIAVYSKTKYQSDRLQWFIKRDKETRVRVMEMPLEETVHLRSQ